MKNKKAYPKKSLIKSITVLDESCLSEYLLGKGYEIQGIKDFSLSSNSLRL